MLVERNSHFNHLYVLPRFAVLPGHEYKAFIPLDKLFSSVASSSSSLSDESEAGPSTPHILVHAEVKSITPHAITLSRPHPVSSSPDGTTVPFDYLIYALGSHLPAPINLWAEVPDDLIDASKVDEPEDLEEDVIAMTGTREAGIAWLQRFQRRVERARSVLVAGGGALGIRMSPHNFLPELWTHSNVFA